MSAPVEETAAKSEEIAPASPADGITKSKPEGNGAPMSNKPSLASQLAHRWGSVDSAEVEATASIPQTDGAGEWLGGSSLQDEPEYEVNIKLSDLQSDKKSPLHSIKAFEELSLRKELLNGIYAMRFSKPSKIQEAALPLLLANPPRNLIGQSQSGTGKTAAFVLNILSRLDLSTPEMRKTPQALVVAPTRELARQIIGVTQVMGSFIDGLSVQPAIPVAREDRGKMIDGQVVVGTPGSTMDLIKKRLMDARSIKVLVLDEADNMLEQQGLGEQCLRLRQILPLTVQVVLFSATFPDRVVRYADKFAPSANQITLRHQDLTIEGIRQLSIDVHKEEAKYDVLVALYGLMSIGSSVIFVRTRDQAAELERRLSAQGHKVSVLTGAFEGNQRDTIIDAFRESRSKVLITTNVLARGIDVQTVSLVVNYDVPELFENGRPTGKGDPHTYLHRIGRTGRFGRVGVAVTLVSTKRETDMLLSIANYYGIEMTLLESHDWDNVEDMIQKTLKSSRAGASFNMSGEEQEPSG